METFLVPIPYRGQRDDIPIALLGPENAEYLDNLDIDNGAMELRLGDSIHSSTSTRELVLHVAAYGEDKLFFVIDDGDIKFYDATSAGAASLAYTLAASGGDDEVTSLYFANRLVFFGEFTMTPSSAGNVYFDGSAWGISGWTFSSILPFGGCSYKNRAYLVGRASSKYAYSGIDSVSGACAEIDLGPVLSKKGVLVAIKALSLSESIEAELVLSFIFNSGEILLYRGQYPAASDWELFGRFVIPEPIGTQCATEIAGDVVVLTATGLISLRDVILRGARVATTESLSAPMKNRWKQVIASVRTLKNLINTVFDQVSNRIIITFPFYTYRNGTTSLLFGHRFIYSIDDQAWNEHYQRKDDSGYNSHAVFFGGNIYYGQMGTTVNCGVTKMGGSSTCYDESMEGDDPSIVEPQFKSSPIFPDKFSNRIVRGIEVLCESNLPAGWTTLKLIGDIYGDSSGFVSFDPSGSTVESVFVNVGISKPIVQLYLLPGAVVGSGGDLLKIYQFRVWLEQGARPR